MLLGLGTGILPGVAIARRLDRSRDLPRLILLTPALALLSLYLASGIAHILELEVEIMVIILNLVALILIRTECDSPKKSEDTERSAWFWIFTLCATFISLAPLTYGRSMGVDWVGFASLADAAGKGTGFMLTEPSSGYWLYPPAFPELAAFLSPDNDVSVFVLGNLSLAALMLAIAAVGDKHGWSHWLILAMLFAPALFAKNLDSGYPTVASQLALIPILFHFDSRLNGRMILLCALCAGLIHPTGLIYVTTLVVASLLVNREWKLTLSEKVQTSLLVGSIFLLMFILAPAFSSDAVFAEYGWQGGKSMVMYSGLLIPLAIWAGWTMRGENNARILIAWFSLNWLFSGVHLFDGLEGVFLLTMLSHVLYSMSMHAFHIPLAMLVGMRLSKIRGGVKSEAGRAVMIAALMLSALAHSALSELSEHSELHVTSHGDENLFALLSKLPDGSIVYTENDPWGHVHTIPEGIGITAVPTLGILSQEHSIQNAATTAIIHDDIERLESLNVTHALASPRGEMWWYLRASTHWDMMYSSQGSILFELSDDYMESRFLPVTTDSMRPDPWAEQRSRDPWNLGDERTYLTEGDHLFNIPANDAYEVCVMLEVVGNVEFTIDDKRIKTSGYYNSCSYDTNSFRLVIHSDAETWINPLGASGRGDKLIDQTGIRIHWVETIHLQ